MKMISYAPVSLSGRVGKEDRFRWGWAASFALHGLCLLSVGALVAPRLSEPVAAPGFDVMFTPPQSSTLTVSSAAIAQPPPGRVVERLSPHLASVSSAAVARPVTAQAHAPAAHRADRLAPMQDKPRNTSADAPVSTASPSPTSHENARGGAAAEVPRELLAILQAKIRLAVKDATIYPDSARMTRREGRAQVGFAFAGGVVSQVALVVSSGSHLLDRAALSAVQRAVMPAAPAQIGNRMLPLQIWVQFNLT